MQSLENPAYMNSGAPQQPATSPFEQEPETPESPLSDALQELNLAEDLDKEELEKIGVEIHQGYKRDLDSKKDWDAAVDEWVKLAAQIREEKNYPWPKASNVKYPLLATAAMQFAARAYPSLVPADGKIVQFKVVGVDMQGMKADKADRLAKHMNYQLTDDMEDWEEEMDRLLIQLPVVGCLFKKTYFDPIKKKNISRLVGAKDLVVNYWATSLETAHRVTEIIPMTANQIKGAQNAGLFLKDVELPDPQSAPSLPRKADAHTTPPSQADASTPYSILECHTFYDLDDDGYAEPYIITLEESSQKVLRIVARFDSDGIYMSDDGKKVTCVEPVGYYTKYGFIPNPDGSFYDIGFGHLLGPLNESTNTVINQLVDAGSLRNLQSGFIGKGLRLKMGETKFQPGEWKTVNATGDDIKKQVFPLPLGEPSDVLFKLLGMLVESGKELASVAEIFTGKMPGQNTPATTTNTAVEQGMKVFTAIYKRIYRAYTKEFKKLFRLNGLYEENFEKAKAVLDTQISPQDYDQKSYDVCPTADPSAVSTTQKMQKAQMLMEVLPLGTVNPLEATKRILEAQEQPNIEALMANAPGPAPDPKLQQIEAQMKMEQEKHQLEMQVKQLEIQLKQQEMEMDLKFKQIESQLKIKLKEQEFQQKTQQQVAQAQLDMQTAQMDAQTQAVIGQQEMQQNAQQHQMQMKQGEQQHQMKMKQQKEQNALRKQAGSAGMAKPSGNAGSNGSSKAKS